MYNNERALVELNDGIILWLSTWMHLLLKKLKVWKEITYISFGTATIGLPAPCTLWR